MRVALIDGVASPDSMGFAIAEALVGRGVEVHATARPHRMAGCRSAAQRLGVRLHEAAEGIDEVVSSLDQLDVLVHTRVHAPPDVLRQPLLSVSGQAFVAVPRPWRMTFDLWRDLCGAGWRWSCARPA